MQTPIQLKTPITTSSLNLIQNILAVKKGAASFIKDLVIKVLKSKVVAKEAQSSPELSLLTITLPSQPFLGHHP